MTNPTPRKMTRADHYQEAERLLAFVKRSERPGDPYARYRLTQDDRDMLALAKVHAALASAPADVAGE